MKFSIHHPENLGLPTQMNYLSVRYGISTAHFSQGNPAVATELRDELSGLVEAGVLRGRVRGRGREFHGGNAHGHERPTTTATSRRLLKKVTSCKPATSHARPGGGRRHV